MSNETPQSQAHSDQQQARTERSQVRDEALRVSGQAHSDRSDVREEALRVSDETHADAVAALAVAKASNPFSLTNVLLATGLLFGGCMAEQVWSGLQDSQKEMQAGIAIVQSTLSSTHDQLLTHGFRLSALQGDMTVLQADMTALKVDIISMQPDTTMLKTGIAVMQTDIVALKSDVTELKSTWLTRDSVNGIVDEKFHVFRQNLAADIQPRAAAVTNITR
jgi:hypothetical protein